MVKCSSCVSCFSFCGTFFSLHVVFCTLGFDSKSGGESGAKVIQANSERGVVECEVFVMWLVNVTCVAYLPVNQTESLNPDESSTVN